MKKFVYLILTFMGFVFFMSINSIDNDKTIKLESNKGYIEINPVY